MEKEIMLKNEGNMISPGWISSTIRMELQASELNCTSGQLNNCFFNSSWANSVDQNDPFESALSSMVSSPATSSAGMPGSAGDNVILRELVGRLGIICNSGDISPQSYLAASSSTNTSSYNTPLNSPPKLGMPLADHQIRGNLLIPGIKLSACPNSAPFASDPGFSERAARFSPFGNKITGGVAGQFGLNESHFPQGLVPRTDNFKLSGISNNQSIKLSEPSLGGQEKKDDFLQDGMLVSDKKISRFSRGLKTESAANGDSREGSSISEQIQGGEIGINSRNDTNSRKRKLISRENAMEAPTSLSCKDTRVADENNRESNVKRNRPNEIYASGKENADGNEKQKDHPKTPEPPKDYIHVRARRGQATDSHSLAERVRREKISQKMKFLQDLVPGCNKVTGKAVMLDEIINYVQSLQRQVEFLSMKLANINPTTELDMEALLCKDINQSRGSFPYNVCNVDDLAHTFPYAFQLHKGTTLNSIVSNGIEIPFSVNSTKGTILRNPSVQLPPINGLRDAASQAPTSWDSDLQSIVQLGFGQNESESLQGTVSATNLKVEL